MLFYKARRNKRGTGGISIGHLEIFSIFSGGGRGREEELKKQQERYKRGKTGAHVRNNRGTKDLQRRYIK